MYHGALLLVKHLCKGAARIVVEPQHLDDWILVATSQIPDYWYPEFGQGLEHNLIPSLHLLSSKGPAKRIINVTIGTSLIDHTVAKSEQLPNGLRKVGQYALSAKV